MAGRRGMLVPATDRERLYMTWYDLSVLYDDALRRAGREADVRETKAVADEAWHAYVDTISDVRAGSDAPAAGRRH